METRSLDRVKRVGTGLAFILYPLLSAIAFLAHPNLLSLEPAPAVSARVAEFHDNGFMHFGHFMMLMGVPLLIVISIHLMNLLPGRGAVLGFLGCVLAVFGAVLLAVDKTALCLAMSAFDAVPEPQYAGLLPGIEALFAFEGYLAILHLLPLLALGFLLQGVALYRARAIPRWQSTALIVSMIGMGVAAAVDIDAFGLVATVILAAAFVPLGVRLIGESASSGT